MDYKKIENIQTKMKEQGLTIRQASKQLSISYMQLYWKLKGYQTLDEKTEKGIMELLEQRTEAEQLSST